MDATLQAFLRNSTLAECMSADELLALVRRLRPISIDEGETLCSAGDPASGAWLLTKGTIEVISKDGILLDTEGPGALIGEQALMPGGLGRRNATLQARTDCRLLAVDEQTFAELLHAHRERLERLSAARTRNHLSRSAETFRALLADSEERTWEEGAFVFREGDRADGLYIVLAGRASVVTVQDGEPVVVAELFPGQVFGEIAVLRDQGRTASVVARQELRAAFVPSARVRERNADNGAVEATLDNLIRSRELPRLGRSQQHAVAVDGELCIQTVFSLDDGRELVGVRAPSGRYTLSQPGAEIDQTVRVAPSTTVDLDAQGRIVGFVDHGDFEDVGGLQLLALDGSPLSRAQRGALNKAARAAASFAPDAQICRCLNVDRQTIQACLDGGTSTLKEVQAATGCGTGCGGCLRKLVPMLSGSEPQAPTLRLGPPASSDSSSGASPIGGFFGWLRSALGG